MDIKDLIGKKIAVRCETEEQSNKFLIMCRNAGIRWSGFGSEVTIPHTQWNSETAYKISDGCLNFASYPFYERAEFEIISADELTDVAPDTSTDFINAAAISAMQGMLNNGGYAASTLCEKAYDYAIALNTQRKLVNAGKM